MPHPEIEWAEKVWTEKYASRPLWADSRPQCIVLAQAIKALQGRFRGSWEAFLADSWWKGHTPKQFSTNLDRWSTQARPAMPLLEQPRLGFDEDFVDKKVQQAKADHAERLRRHREGTAEAMLKSPKLDKDSQKRLMREAIVKLRGQS